MDARTTVSNAPGTFASNADPLRASLLPSLFRCPKMFHKMIRDNNDSTERSMGEEPAQTGSLVHLGINAYNSPGGNLRAGLRAINNARQEYPDGNHDKAYSLFNKYVDRLSAEPRGRVVYSEWKVTVKLPPATFDPTQEEIVITGTLDTVRDCGDIDYVEDAKTGMMSGGEMVKYYAPQLAVYMIGCSLQRGKPVAGFITRVADLVRKDLPFWHPMGFDLAGAYKVLDVVRSRVASIRAGMIDVTPGKHCDYCPLTPYPTCFTGREVEAKQKRQRTPLTNVEELFK